MKRPFEDGLSLLVGAGVGIAAMYLLDPDQGRQRRDTLRRSTHDALTGAGAAASSGVEQLREIAGKASDYAQQYASQFVGAGQDAVSNATGSAAAAAANLSDKAASLRQQLSDTLDHWKDSGRRQYGKSLNRASLALGRDEDHHYIGQTTCAIGSLAVGAGLVYFLDPRHGAERRDRILNRSMQCVTATGEFFRHMGSYVGAFVVPGRGRGSKGQNHNSHGTGSVGERPDYDPNHAFPAESSISG